MKMQPVVGFVFPERGNALGFLDDERGNSLSLKGSCCGQPGGTCPNYDSSIEVSGALLPEEKILALLATILWSREGRHFDVHFFYGGRSSLTLLILGVDLKPPALYLYTW